MCAALLLLLAFTTEGTDVPLYATRADAALVRDTNTVFSMTPFETRAEWERYAEGLRRRILVSCGLWPLPERGRLNAAHRLVAEHDDYIVEAVRFESWPGVYVTGNLYRPVGDGPFPGIVCPHGHWGKGRFEDSDTGSVPARSITFARMGMVSFSYDMVGYNDSLQYPEHGWEDPLEKLWGIHPFAFQLWNAIRAVDFLESLPYVDRDRLACTGASGGGTQTFTLMAVDPRIRTAAPVNMISHTMQGGCVCENAPLLRIAASNMEIGALMAPRPLLLVSATGDWTRATPEVEYPAIRGIYALYEAEDRVDNVHIDAGHNYNKDSREAVYRFFGKWVLGDAERWADFTEPAYTLEPVEALRVFPDGTQPAGLKTRPEFVPDVIAAIGAKWRALLPASPDRVGAFRRTGGPAFADAFGVADVAALRRGISAQTLRTETREGYSIEHLTIRRGDEAAIPALRFRPERPAGRAVVLVDPRGKAGLLDERTGGPGALVRGLLAKGCPALVIDTFMTGALAGDARTSGKFPDTFVPSDTAYRVQDIVTGLAYLRGAEKGPVALAGLGDAGIWALFAAALDGEAQVVVADAAGFDPDDDTAWVERQYVPSIRAVGDVRTAAALVAPRPLILMNTGGAAGWRDAARCYGDAAGGRAHVHDEALPVVNIVTALNW